MLTDAAKLSPILWARRSFVRVHNLLRSDLGSAANSTVVAGADVTGRPAPGSRARQHGNRDRQND